MLSKPELDELANDIRDNGLQNPIIRQGDVIIDGRNRLAACKLVKVEPEFKEFTGTDPVAFIISQNIHRRHLTESQRAMVAAKIANMERGGDRKSDQSANLRNDISQTNAAALLNVSRRSVQDAKAIADASPDLADAVLRGEKTVHAARQEIKETETHTTKTETKEVTEKKLSVGYIRATNAIKELESIPARDKEREMAMGMVQDWIQKHQ
jgi:ParB-like chromosome segregation protein Spo0J